MDTASGTGPSFTVAVGPEGLRVTVTLLDERTFVFTDIELSSAHWQRDEEAMCRVMPSHHQLIEAAFCKWRGTVLRGEGDSCVALFPSPVDALEASGDIQRELGRAPWEVDLKVRVGLHTGRVYQLSESEYGGTPLNYLGRLHMAGHGGQILVSDITASLLDAELPTGWELIDLGDFVLKDFPRRRIFQAAHPDLERHFPPLNAVRPIQGPAPPDNAFIGRQSDIAAVRSALGRGVTTITGPVGIGKTRLALEIAHEIRDEYRDGVCTVELAGVREADHLAVVVANALQIDPHLEATVEESIARSLSSRSLLVILDNCEHVATRARFLAAALSSLPDVHVLATSRVPLEVGNEQVYPLAPLAQADADANAVEVAASDAVRLFAERVRVARPTFTLDAASTKLAGDICRSLSGVPLSIELAAAALQTVPLSILVRELSTGGTIPATALDSARARSAIEWSIDSLRPDELALFTTLAVFPGGAPAELLAEVHPEGSARNLIDPLDTLVKRALVQLEDSAAGGHYRLLEPMRLAALERVEPAVRAELESRHAAAVSALAIAAEPRLRSGGEVQAVDDLDRLFTSLRASVHRDIEQDPDRATRVLLATHEYCFLRMRYEMYSWTETLLEQEELSPSTASVLYAISGLASFNRGDLESAKTRCLESIELAHDGGVEPHVYARFGLIASYGFDCQFDQAQAHFADALRWCSTSTNEYFLVNTLVLGAMSMTIQGDARTGRKLSTSALEIGERIANPSSIAWSLCAVADAERLESPGAAHLHLEEALRVARTVQSRWVEGQALLNLATLCWQSNVEEGAVALVDALTNAERTGSPIHCQQALRVAALLLGQLGRTREAALLLGPSRRHPIALPPAPDVAQGLDGVRNTCLKELGADVFDAYLGQGRRMAESDLLPLARHALTDAVPA
jgi:predicted ATPase/class 3 adenylate cyclase